MRLCMRGNRYICGDLLQNRISSADRSWVRESYCPIGLFDCRLWSSEAKRYYRNNESMASDLLLRLISGVIPKRSEVIILKPEDWQPIVNVVDLLQARLTLDRPSRAQHKQANNLPFQRCRVLGALPALEAAGKRFHQFSSFRCRVCTTRI